MNRQTGCDDVDGKRRKRMKPEVAGAVVVAGYFMIAGVAAGGSPALGGEGATGATGSFWEECGTLSLHDENDFWAGSDQNYTNGLRLEWLSRGREFHWGSGATWAGRLTGTAESGEIVSQWGLAMQQLMFTGVNSRELNPEPGEHPYGGYLALGGAWVVKSPDVSNTFEFQIGTTGGVSLAEAAQKNFHEMIRAPRWRGWDSQLPQEITAQLSWQQKRRMAWLESGTGGLETDGYWYWQADLGTVYCRAGLGAVVRVGQNLATIAQRQMTIQPANFLMEPFVSAKAAQKKDWAWYAQFGITGRAVAHDIFLDGTVFRDAQRSVSREPWVMELSGGVGIRYKDLIVSYGYTMRTKDHKTQNRHQTLGELTLGWSF